MLKSIDIAIQYGPVSIGRFSHTSHVINKTKLLLVGGLSSKLEFPKESSGQIIGLLDLTSAKLVEFFVSMSPQPRNGLPLIFNHVSFCDDERGSLYILGGGSNCFSFGMHVNDSVLRLPLNNIQLL